MTAAERWACDRCPFTYDTPLPLNEPPLHPCPTPNTRRRRPAPNRQEPPA